MALCALLHSEYAGLDQGPSTDSGEEDDKQAEEHHIRSRARFAQLVREAAHDRGRLI